MMMLISVLATVLLLPGVVMLLLGTILIGIVVYPLLRWFPEATERWPLGWVLSIMGV